MKVLKLYFIIISVIFVFFSIGNAQENEIEKKFVTSGFINVRVIDKSIKVYLVYSDIN
jgi:hypothetical protein